jgi:hypothetical protein
MLCPGLASMGSAIFWCRLETHPPSGETGPFNRHGNRQKNGYATDDPAALAVYDRHWHEIRTPGPRIRTVFAFKALFDKEKQVLAVTTKGRRTPPFYAIEEATMITVRWIAYVPWCSVSF